MFAQRELNDLAERKRLLVLQADLHRVLLRAEGERVRAQLKFLNEARKQVRAASPWLAVGAAAAGLLAASRWRTLARWIPTVVGVWRGVQQFRSQTRLK